MHVTSEVSSDDLCWTKQQPLSWKVSLCCSSVVAVGCAMTLPIRILPCTCQPCALFCSQIWSTCFKNIFLFKFCKHYFPRWSSAALGLFHPLLSEGRVWFHTWKDTGGFPLPGAFPTTEQFQCYSQWDRVCLRKGGATSLVCFLSLVLLWFSRQESFLFHDFKGSVWVLSLVAEGSVADSEEEGRTESSGY